MKPALPTLLAACAALALSAASCGTAPTATRVHEVREGALLNRSLRSMHSVYSANSGIVGFLREYDVSEAGGPAYRWSYVYDKGQNELGWIDQFGTAWLAMPRSPFEADAHQYSVRVKRLPSDEKSRNVMRMLGMDPALDSVTFPAASDADIMGAK